LKKVLQKALKKVLGKILKRNLKYAALACVVALPVVLLQGCIGVFALGTAAGVSVANDSRTTGTIVEDQSIEFKVSDLLVGDDELNEKTHINVTSYNNVVLLSGEAPTAILRERAAKLTQQVEKVKWVQNEIVVASSSTGAQRRHDAWLTTKIKSMLLKDSGLDAVRVKVVTESSVVFLLGLLTRAEADTVVDIVRHVDGVKRVVKMFEYQD